MKQKLFFWMFFLAVGSGTLQAQVNNLIIKSIDGTEITNPDGPAINLQSNAIHS